MSFFFNDYDAEDAYYIFVEYLSDPTHPAFNPDDFPGVDYDFEEYVQLEKIGKDKKIYLTVEDVLDMLNEPYYDRAGSFDHDEKGFYEIIIAPQGYRVIDWTNEMKDWIAAHKNQLEIDDEE